MNGNLVNITTPRTSINKYRNVINYTSQATSIGSSYKSFTLPLSNNKVILFITSLFHRGDNEPNGDPFNPITLEINSTV